MNCKPRHLNTSNILVLKLFVELVDFATLDWVPHSELLPIVEAELEYSETMQVHQQQYITLWI